MKMEVKKKFFHQLMLSLIPNKKNVNIHIRFFVEQELHFSL